MRPRRLLSVLLATLMVVMSFSSAVLAYGDAITFTLPTGLTIALPSEYDTIWYGMSDDDPLFEEDDGISPSFVREMYEQGNIELQGGYDPANGDPGNFFFTICFEQYAPDTIDTTTTEQRIANNTL